MKRSGPPERRTPMRRDGDGARRFAAKRGELKRTPLEGTAPLARTGQLKARSAKRQAVYDDHRKPYIEALVAAGVGCEICPMLAEAGVRTHCSGRIEGLHERRKRSAGGSLTNRQNLIPACNWSNGWIEDNPRQARDLFGDALVVREGDPEYRLLGARSDG